MKKTLKKEGIEWIRTILIGVLLAVFFRTFFFSTYVVEGKSMMPTLQDGNMLVVNKVSYHVGDLNRFDVVVFHANKKEDYVKRIIGLPGDHIEYKHDKLYVNGQYRKSTLPTTVSAFTNPKCLLSQLPRRLSPTTKIYPGGTDFSFVNSSSLKSPVSCRPSISFLYVSK